ncbi:MAG: tetratricopeptide repeat protein [Desulfobacterales bacterium]|nr:tetratricopeptide repeat protein [Desulfobacterales bacterium]
MTPDKTHKSLFGSLRWSFLVCLLLVLINLAAYWQVKNHEFIDYDDIFYVVENQHVRSGLNQRTLVWAFKSTELANWHPLTWVSHLLDVRLYGLQPGPHHLTNLLLHILNTILLFLILMQMTGAIWRSAFVAALFALHPLHVESVAQVAGRKDVLSTFFGFLALLSYVWYVRKPGSIRYLMVFLFFVMGLMSKPMLVTLPFVLLLLDYWPLERMQTVGTYNTDADIGHKQSFFQLFWEKIPLFVLAAASCVATYIFQNQGGAIGSLTVYPFEVRAANVLVSYIRYIVKMFWPTHLAFFYPHPGMWPFWKSAGAFLLLFGASILLIRTAKERPYLIVGWLWYLGMLFPVIGVVQLGSQAMADRYTYVPLIGLFIMTAWGAFDLSKGWHYQKMALTGASVFILSALTVATWVQAGYWQNSLKLFAHSIAVTTGNLMAHNNMGIALEKKGQTEKAIQHYQKALQIDPGFAHTYNNLGNALFSLGKTREAETHYFEALRLDPMHANAHYNLGNIFQAQGRLDVAIDYYLKALQIDPFFAKAHNNLGGALIKQGRTMEAMRHFYEALKIRPDYTDAFNNLKKVYQVGSARKK